MVNVRNVRLAARSRIWNLSALVTVAAVMLLGLTVGPVGSPAQAWTGTTINGAVNVSKVAPDGSIYIGGGFTEVNGTNRNLVAKFAADGTLDTAFDAGLTASGEVVGLDIAGDYVYVSGSIPGSLARYDKTTGALDSGWNTASWLGSINDVLVDGTDVYATGQGTVARMTTSDPTRTWSTALLGDTSRAGRRLILDGSTLYVVGQFEGLTDSVTTTVRRGVAALDPADGSVKSAFNANMGSGGIGFGATVVGSNLYLGGFFSSVGGQARNGLAAVDKESGALAAWNPGVSGGNIFAVASDSAGNVYAGGFFTSLGATPVTRGMVAALDPTTGEALDWNPMGSGGPVQDINVTGTGATTNVYVGGIFSAMGGSSTPSEGAAAPMLSQNGNGRFNALAGANVLIPPQARSVSLAGNQLSWTDAWFGGQQYAWVLYKRSTDPDVMRSWKVFAYGNTNGGTGQTPQTLTIDASCPSGWTCPRPIGFEGGVTYEFNVIMRSYAGKNSGGPNAARATYTPALSALALPATGDQSAAQPAPLSGESSTPTTDPAASPTPLASPTGASATKTALVVKDVARTVKAGRKTRLVQAGVPDQATQAKSRTTVSRASIKSRSECLVGGQKVTGKDKKRICGIKTKSKPTKLVTWAAPACNTKLKIRTTITAHTPGDQPAVWSQQWKVTRPKNSPKITCSQLTKAP